jgi:hypothetical protein
MAMAVDAQQAERHLAGMPSEAELKDRMVRQIVGDRRSHGAAIRAVAAVLL